jgi:hypothetical protein
MDVPKCLGTNHAYGYNTPYVDASLRHLQLRIKFAKFDDSKITSEYVLFCSFGEGPLPKESAVSDACGARIQYVMTRPSPQGTG